MKYANFVFEHNYQNTCNLGDYIQSLAAQQFLPVVDYYVSRENFGLFKPTEMTKIIANGWFSNSIVDWKFNPNLIMNFISFHMSPPSYPVLKNSSLIDLFKKFEPIGCRDFNTLEILDSFKIASYFSSCLTTTLEKENYSTQISNDILFVDALYNTEGYTHPSNKVKKFVKDNFSENKRNIILKQIFDSSILSKKQELSTIFTYNSTHEERFYKAKYLLSKFASATLVVTSRIHCALPCLAFGTPVIFLVNNLNQLQNTSRFSGIIDFFNFINLNEKFEIISNFYEGNEKISIHNFPINSNNHMKYKQLLINNLSKFNDLEQ